MTVLLEYEVAVPPGRLGEVQQRFDRDYLPLAADRGMTYLGAFITPPIELDDAPTTLVWRFSLPDTTAVWAMKRQVGDDVKAFWLAIDAVATSRSRRFLVSFGAAGAEHQLPSPQPTGATR